MQARVDAYIRRHKLLKKGDRLLVAVSGGPDSICLLHILDGLSCQWNWSLIVAHLEHGLRGATSIGDAAYVQRLAEQLGWPYVVEQQDIAALLRQQGGSLQEVCRLKRHEFLQEAATDKAAQAIVLGHHAGDQAETVLLHLLRGAGLTGIAGMSTREAGVGSTALVRPLLAESKASIMAYLREQGVGFRADSSNAEAEYERNRLRLQVMPLLSTFNPLVEQTIARSAQVLQAEEEYLSQLGQAAFVKIKVNSVPLSIQVEGLSKHPLALQRRILRLAWQKISGGPQDLSFMHVDDALDLLTKAAGSVTSWPRNWQVRRGYDKLVFEAARAEASKCSCRLPIPGMVELPEQQGSIATSIVPKAGFLGYGSDQNIAYCDLETLATTELQVRYWRPGDVFQPLGLGGSKKLQDFFTDAKIDRRRRLRIPLVLAGDEIVWVAGLRLDERWRVTADSSKLLKLEYKKNLSKLDS